MKKKIVGLIIIFAFVFLQVCAFSEQKDMNYYISYKTIEIKGKLDNVNNNKFVTAILRNEGNIVNISETIIDDNGRYKTILRIPQNVQNISLSVKCGDENVSTSGYDVILKEIKYLKLPYDVYEQNGQYHIKSNLSKLGDIADKICIIAAQYESGGKLKDCKMVNLEELPQEYEFEVQKKGELRLFAWVSNESMVPAAELSELGGEVIVKFGDSADNQVRNGYIPIIGNNNYERYKNAKNEIDDECNIITEQKPEIARSIYVSANGDDDGDGSINYPFKTLNRAIEKYYALSSEEKEEWTGIYLRGGTYNITENINVTKAITDDSNDARLYIGAYNNEDVYIKNSIYVYGSSFKKVTSQNTDEDILKRIDNNVENLYYCNYSDLGINKMTGYSYGNEGTGPILIYNGKRTEQSRYPDCGEAYAELMVDSGCNNSGEYTEYVEFVPEDKKPFSWGADNEVKMNGQLCVSWYINNMQAFVDADKKTIKTPARQAAVKGVPCDINLSNNPEEKSHFYYYNIFDEITVPGEWYSSDKEQRLYIYPPDKVMNENDLIEIPGETSGYTFNFTGVKNVILDNINFTVLNNGINISECENIIVQNCNFDNVRLMCGNISNSKKCGFLKSNFLKSYKGVLIAGGKNDVENLVPARNFIQDCYFNTLTNTCIYIQSSNGNIISHNTAEKYKGIFVGLFSGCENIIEYNETYAGGIGGNEMYVFYVNGWYSTKYNHIRNNYIHDTSPDVNEIKLSTAVYLDDMGEDNFVYNNIFQNLISGVGINGGDNNIIDSNVFINCESYSAYSTDHMYVKEKNFDAMINSDRTNYNMSDSSIWMNRYQFVKNRKNYIMEIKDLWNSGDHSSDKIKFAIASTGNYFVNNSIINSPMPKIGIYYKDYYITDNPEINIRQSDGNDYSVIFNNTEDTEISDLMIQKMDEAGIQRPPKYTDDNTIEVIYPQKDIQNRSDDKLEVWWKDTDCADFYKIIIAEDSEFKNIVTEKWLKDNRYTQNLQIYPRRQTAYYYRIEAYNFAHSKTLIGQSSVKTVIFDEFKQKENKIIISPQQSNSAEFWRGAVGDEYVRKFNDGAYTIQKNDSTGDYVSFNTINDADNEYRFIRKSGNEYVSAESILDCCDLNTTIEISMKFMIPSEDCFGEYINIPYVSFAPWKYASSKAGQNGQSVYFRIEKNGEDYIVYRGLRNVNTTMPRHKRVGVLTKDEMIGKWIDVNISVNMKEGTAVGTLGNLTADFEMNNCSVYEYQWNSENFLRHFDIALKPNATNGSEFYARDIEVVRKPITQ